MRTHWIFAVAFFFLAASAARANVCASPTLSVRHVHGRVTDQTGQPIAGAVVELKELDQTVAEARTDDQGRFSIKIPRGRFNLSVNAQGFMNAWAPLKVGWSIRSLFHSDLLLVALGVGSLGCPPEVTTSIQVFNRQILAK